MHGNGDGIGSDDGVDVTGNGVDNGGIDVTGNGVDIIGGIAGDVGSDGGVAGRTIGEGIDVDKSTEEDGCRAFTSKYFLSEGPPRRTDTILSICNSLASVIPPTRIV